MSTTDRTSAHLARSIPILPLATALMYVDGLATQQDCEEALGFEIALNNRSAVQDALRRRMTTIRIQHK
jgi:hypothetical protein